MTVKTGEMPLHEVKRLRSKRKNTATNKVFFCICLLNQEIEIRNVGLWKNVKKIKNKIAIIFFPIKICSADPIFTHQSLVQNKGGHILQNYPPKISMQKGQ